MIELKHLSKQYETTKAVDDISLTIQTGEFFGLLGSNGAGKTTTIGMLSTLLLPTSGEIFIDGEQLSRSRSDIKRKISVITQEYSMRQDMTMDEIMEYQGRLYYMPVKQIRKKSEELLEFCGLLKDRRKTVRKLSGGMKRKLMVCRALLTEPQILLLDEPTVGMDALARRQMWDLLRRLNKQGITILLTTHYIEEAQMLCDRVAMMEKGKVTRINTPTGFIQELGSYAVDALLPDGVQTSFFETKSAALEHAAGIDGNLKIRETSLEDVFVELASKNRREGR